MVLATLDAQKMRVERCRRSSYALSLRVERVREREDRARKRKE